MTLRCPFSERNVPVIGERTLASHLCMEQECALWFKSVDVNACCLTMLARVVAYGVSDIIVQLRTLESVAVRLPAHEDS